MNRSSTLVMAGKEHARLHEHLFPGDGKEAAAILVCTRVDNGPLKLLVRQLVMVPHHHCQRSPGRLIWPSDILDELQQRAGKEGLSLVLVHSHPGGYFDFSAMDDEADQLVMHYLYPYGRADAATANGLWHGSAIMVPGGHMRARLYNRARQPHPVELIAVYGDDIKLYWNDAPDIAPRPMAFSGAMRDELSRLSIAIVGLSGTGSIVAEQLLRMGVGELIIIDHDVVEEKNLNRILNTTKADADNARAKVLVFKEAAALSHPATSVIACQNKLGSLEAILAVAQADILFSCVDTYAGRHLADRLAATMVQPLFDVGVVIPVRNPPRGPVISNICGRIDYIQPQGSTLADRQVYTPALLAEEYLREANPDAYAGQVKEGYMPGTTEEAPSVITVNMRAASEVVQELIARAYPYRWDPNRNCARSEFDLCSGQSSTRPENSFPCAPCPHYAQGLSAPLLGLPMLEDLRCA